MQQCTVASQATGEPVHVQWEAATGAKCITCGAPEPESEFLPGRRFVGIPKWSHDLAGTNPVYTLWGEFCSLACATERFVRVLQHTRVPLVSHLALMDLSVHVSGGAILDTLCPAIALVQDETPFSSAPTEKSQHKTSQGGLWKFACNAHAQDL